MPGVAVFPHVTVAGARHHRRRADRVRARARASGDGRRASRTTPAGRSSTRARSRSDASSRDSATTAKAAARFAASAVRSARTCTGRCCRATRGSPTGCWRGRSRIAPARARRLEPLAETRAPRTLSPPNVPAGPAAAAPRTRLVPDPLRLPPLGGARSRLAGREPRRAKSRVTSTGKGELEGGTRRSRGFPPRIERANAAARRPQRAVTSGRPERAEVNDRVAGAPARQEALDRWMEHNVVQLVELVQTMAAHRDVLRRDLLERPAGQVGGEDDVDNVLPREAAGRGDRVDIATGPSTGGPSSMPTSSASSRCSAPTRLSPESTPPPGSSQYSRPPFS